MSVLIYVDSENGKIKKAATEVASYGRKVANSLGTQLVALAVNVEDVAPLSAYGVDKVLQLNAPQLTQAAARPVVAALAQATAQEGSTVLLFSSGVNARTLAPMIAARLGAGYVSGVSSLPETTPDFSVKRSVFSGKGIAIERINTPVKILSLAHNAFPIETSPTTAMTVEVFAPTLPEAEYTVTNVERHSGKVALDDAEIIVSGGRGLKGAEHWGMIEALADVLGAATACSKPVADMGWRPHSEHVGQTGKPVAPNLYIAIGISGAIQHLAGVNASKVKLVINSDPEAPFFKSADYGVVGDAFEIVPKLTQLLKDRGSE
ncbi:electron transfer flavoprotein alpha subunit apoprotein [Capnocytophaga haemolytica]|uniref:Electron transfer flavoprotein large subunit n=1 Tax=Capnocytophaga haemolytica TaxID=45243 RepID=A0AAX2GXD8_9FLAO|nr:electron transfer flavoprotein subunit alpha/FixB family protein [Capnocytophaga haemolytica]AMD85054.1 electron transfer flavoprotein subunit alpha [Capnocytophaga haemolytica]SFN69601.1 electron transfer flavoprotein alpha subunit apoprotein [Capnocytophaga haemolytica]SNV05376.1 Electron transfer flavoprotein large subunit [Capnocytophaga haemolytica]